MENNDKNTQVPQSLKTAVMPRIYFSKECDWCKKRKITRNGYLLGKLINDKKEWFICNNCNIIHDVV